MRVKALALAGLAAAALAVAACGGSGSGSSASSATPTASSPPASRAGMSATRLTTSTVGGVRVLANSKGFTLYWFAPDTSTTSKCTGTCAAIWPPAKGPATAGSGVTGTLGAITRPDGSIQATYDGHPLYTYTADTAPGQAKGNGVNASGGVWHEVTVSGGPAPSPSNSTSSGGGGGGGYGY